MDRLTPPALLRAAYDAGLTVAAAGDTLVVQGPPRADAAARALCARKADILPLVRAGAELPGLVLHLAAESDWPCVMTITGQHIGPGEADWRRVVQSPRLQEPGRGMLLGGLKGALARRLAGVPRNESWSEWVQRAPDLPRNEALAVYTALEAEADDDGEDDWGALSAEHGGAATAAVAADGGRAVYTAPAPKAPRYEADAAVANGGAR